VWDLYATVEREGSGDDRIRNARPNRIADLYDECGPFRVLLNGRRSREWRRSFGDLTAEMIALPSTSPRPLHWNTATDREAAIEEWRRALADVPGD
ncbi:MAG: DNA-deoxyinosine glycosylase, partial [Chloroflexi bacterium]|nr:DNA-deoxyinosine glycosylase [Chloroflexota bacterium]